MRGTGPLAAALLLAVLAHFGLPLPPVDPLRSTLVLLPLVVVALIGVGRWAKDGGGASTPTPVVAAEAAILGVLVLITLGRNHLGVGPTTLLDRCLFGGYATLLGHRLWWLVRSLRSTLGPELPRFAPAPFFALPFIVYLAVLPWTTTHRPPDGDAPHYLLLTHSLAYDLDTDLQNNYDQDDSLEFMSLRLEPQLGDPEGGQGELYSRHNVLMPLILAPFYRLGGLFGVLVVMAAMTAATCWLTLSLARGYDPGLPEEAVFAWAILAFTAPFLLFSYQVWVEIPAALLVVVALIQIHRLREDEGASKWHWLMLFGSMLLLPLLKIRFLLISVPLACLAIWQGGRRARVGAALLLLSLLVLASGILLFNQQVFQNPLKYHDIDGLRSYSQPAGSYLRGFVGLFFDCAFGLFAQAPIWMLLLPAMVVLARQRHRVLLDFGFVFAPYLLALSPRGEWFGGWSPPFRYGIVMLPILALWFVPLLRDRRRAGSLSTIVVLLVGTLVLTTLWLAVPGWTFNLAHGRSHVLDQLSTQLGADVARFLPSSTRLRTATFLWPPLAFIAMTCLWLWRRRPATRKAILWSVAVALLAPALLVWSSQHRATHVVEFEDPWFSKDEGKVFPDLWVVYRPRYRGGWQLSEGASLHLPAVAGGERLDLQVELRLGPQTGEEGVIEVADSEGRIVNRAEVGQAGEWTSLTLEDLPWEAGEPLTLTFRGPEKPRAKFYKAIFDRATLVWK